MPGPRIVTLTLNPAVDMAAEASAVRPVHKIRTFGERYDAGGGGVNVARVLNALGAETMAVVVGGGVTGRLLEEMLTQSGVPFRTIPIQAATRISLTVLDHESGLEYRFVPPGPQLSEKDCAAVLSALEFIDADWLIASGSLPPGVPTDFYANVARVSARRGIKFALDTSGQPLRAALGSGVELLKPSLAEFEWLLGRKTRDFADQQEQAQSLARAGAASLISVTLGDKGAILATAKHAISLAAPPVSIRTTVGAGDAFAAGLVLGLARGWSEREALSLGLAAAASAISSPGTAQVNRMEVEKIYGKMSEEPPASLPYAGLP